MIMIIIYNAPEGIVTHPEASREFSEGLSRLVLGYKAKNRVPEEIEVEGQETDLPAGYIIVLRKKDKGSQKMSQVEGDLMKAIALLLGEILHKYAKGEYEIEFVTQFH